MTRIPIVNALPEDSERYKFVQLYIGDEPYLRVQRNMYHTRIVGLFCEELGIGTEKIRNENDVLLYPDSPDVKIVGMGSIRKVYPKGYRYGGVSGSYDIVPDRNHMTRIAEMLNEEFIFDESLI